MEQSNILFSLFLSVLIFCPSRTENENTKKKTKQRTEQRRVFCLFLGVFRHKAKSIVFFSSNGAQS